MTRTTTGETGRARLRRVRQITKASCGSTRRSHAPAQPSNRLEPGGHRCVDRRLPPVAGQVESLDDQGRWRLGIDQQWTHRAFPSIAQGEQNELLVGVIEERRAAAVVEVGPCPKPPRPGRCRHDDDQPARLPQLRQLVLLWGEPEDPAPARGRPAGRRTRACNPRSGPYGSPGQRGEAPAEPKNPRMSALSVGSSPATPTRAACPPGDGPKRTTRWENPPSTTTRRGMCPPGMREHCCGRSATAKTSRPRQTTVRRHPHPCCFAAVEPFRSPLPEVASHPLRSVRSRSLVVSTASRRHHKRRTRACSAGFSSRGSRPHRKGPAPAERGPDRG